MNTLQCRDAFPLVETRQLKDLDYAAFQAHGQYLLIVLACKR